MNEIWKDVEGYEGYYSVSNFGAIKSHKRKITRRNGRSQTFNERICKQVNKGNNRVMVALFREGKADYRLVHRLVANAFISNPESKPQINHKDGNPLNNKLENLEWCTDKENMKHAIENGLNNRYVLDLEEEEEIIKKYNDSNDSVSSLSREYNVSRRTIKRIVNNERNVERMYKWKKQ